MFIRIVKLGFRDDFIETFLERFETDKYHIRQFPGCQHLELYRDKNDPSQFFTYSFWEAEEHLEAYRNSALFKDIWSRTKIGFNRRPEAWSVNRLESLP